MLKNLSIATLFIALTANIFHAEKQKKQYNRTLSKYRSVFERVKGAEVSG